MDILISTIGVIERGGLTLQSPNPSETMLKIIPPAIATVITSFTRYIQARVWETFVGYKTRKS